LLPHDNPLLILLELFIVTEAHPVDVILYQKFPVDGDQTTFDPRYPRVIALEPTYSAVKLFWP